MYKKTKFPTKFHNFPPNTIISWEGAPIFHIFYHHGPHPPPPTPPTNKYLHVPQSPECFGEQQLNLNCFPIFLTFSESGTDLEGLIDDKDVAAKAVAFVVNSSRRGVVPLCAHIAKILKAKRR